MVPPTPDTQPHSPLPVRVIGSPGRSSSARSARPGGRRPDRASALAGGEERGDNEASQGGLPTERDGTRGDTVIHLTKAITWAIVLSATTLAEDPPVLPLTTLPGRPIALADYDQDGVLDILLRTGFAVGTVGGYEVRRGRGDGSFGYAKPVIQAQGPSGHSFGADMDQDGLVDLVEYMGYGPGATISVHRALPNAEFAAPTTTELAPPVGLPFYGVAAPLQPMDMDADGIPDAWAFDLLNDSLLVLPARPPGSSALRARSSRPRAIAATRSAISTATILSTGDATRDGGADGVEIAPSR